MNKEASSCTTMQGSLVNPTSNGGGDSGLNYTFSFTPSVPPPPTGTLVLNFPSDYISLISLKATC